MMDKVLTTVTGDTSQQVGVTSESQGSPETLGPSSQGSPGGLGSHLTPQTPPAPKEQAVPNLDWKTVQKRKGRLMTGKTVASNPSSLTSKFKMPLMKGTYLWNSGGRK